MTQHMTKTEIILSMRDLPLADIVQRTGFKKDIITTTIWRHRHPERHRANQRSSYHRLKVEEGFGGIEGGKWQPADDLQLIKLIRAGKSYTECGKAFRVTRNCVAGRVHRLRQEGRL